MDYMDDLDTKTYLKSFDGYQLAVLIIDLSEYYTDLQFLNDPNQLAERLRDYVFFKKNGYFKNEQE